MKKGIQILALCLCFIISSCDGNLNPALTSKQGINFKVITLAQARAAAKAEDKPLFVFAHASWCSVCKQMEHEVFVQKDLGDTYNQGFINVAIDVDSPEGKNLSEQYPVNATPTLLFFQPDGSPAKRIEGFTTAGDLLSLAKELKAK